MLATLLRKMFEESGRGNQGRKARHVTAVRVGPGWVRSPLDLKDMTLNPGAVRWLRALPISVAPIALAERYPRICNRLAALAADPGETRRYINILLGDTRGGRTGFAATIRRELLILREEVGQTDSNISRPDTGTPTVEADLSPHVTRTGEC